MKKNRFAFVILHYLTITDTEKCINSILKLHKAQDTVQIVIVDNASPNGTGLILKDRYSKDKRITVLLSKENLGFARGNNLGFQYAKNILNADFIITINNDTYITQTDFLEQIAQEYENSKFAVLGPKIILKNNKINNIYSKLQSLEHYKKDLGIMKREYILNQLYFYPAYKYLRTTLSNTLKCIGLKKKNIFADPNNRHENIILHGCALIFSKKYINIFDGFDSRTFLYREEELLYLRIKQAQLNNVYNPQIEIHHNEDGSTDAITGGGREKRTFVMKNLIESTKLLIKELEQNEKI